MYYYDPSEEDIYVLGDITSKEVVGSEIHYGWVRRGVPTITKEVVLDISNPDNYEVGDEAYVNDFGEIKRSNY